MTGHRRHPPGHIGIIMDGNRRWAEQRGFGHAIAYEAGCAAFHRIHQHCAKLGVRNLTCFAFSTENWQRAPQEIATVFGIFEAYVTDHLSRVSGDPSCATLRIFGDDSLYEPAFRRLVHELNALPENTRSCTAHVAINYGGQQDITRAVRHLIGARADITEDSIAQVLQPAAVPGIDLIIRTGQEIRLSNFMLWQAAQAELIFCKRHWPEFSHHDLDAALAEFALRKTAADMPNVAPRRTYAD